MKNRWISLFSCVALLSFAASLIEVRPSAAAPNAGDAAALAPMTGHGGAMPGPAGAAPAQNDSPTITGKVVETMDAGPYTYVQVDDGTKKVWAAAPKFAVAVGNEVAVPSAMPMQNFQSKALGRTFDLVYFAQSIQVKGQEVSKEKLSATHAKAGVSNPSVDLDFSKISKPEGGHTVAELFAGKADLAGKEVVVRGKVAKFNGGIMGKNWIHIQDGTGSAGTNDLTVTGSATSAVGDTVLVRGKLSTDKDFGSGYKYEVIIEDAAVTVE